ncbi:hypothetical protein ASF99_00235 [Exiguobacterium sp. Leaf187]|uniref:DUF3388 domain-containing protein n=4 Tax=Exiguobacterium TaxID=33986 RepID=A0A0V8GGC7_9BACL|nr:MULTISPECIES: DUF3388 domain-containing protein [Exiguobacterium]MBF8153503.1 DUF3388 domain-containing protein [Exiguobacterium sp. TBG-PICH-001]MCQ4090863.1 DUF3388 domain-containing protein [Exiguobacterium sp. LL15]NTY08967.1 DUF3388 domain-containing protein [Exiguobacterium sp. JMULE1]AHA29313.1 hypothetical protein U719_05335 [Exiguobacterium sp. MH3]AOT00153.1 hypothetical protein ESP131_07725 [Exiguobacterium sp. U13-1]
MSEFEQWYLEYELKVNRPGILGDIASLMGMLHISIVTINGVDHQRRGMLLQTKQPDQIPRLAAILKTMSTIEVIKLRKPKLRDRIAIRHGRYIDQSSDERKTFRFVREDLGILVDFMAELCKQDGHLLIGVRGMPRVGKTESIVAASVSANKKWLFLSSTLIKQTVRTSLFDDERTGDYVYIIDALVSQRNFDERHWQILREVMRLPATKIVEHPDAFVKSSEYTWDDFDYIIELRNTTEEIIVTELPRSHGGNDWFNFE